MQMNSNGAAGSRFAGGVVVPLFDREHLDFSYLVARDTEVVTLAEAVNVAFATSALLVVRVHVNNLGAEAAIKILCYPTAPSAEDPAEFTESTAELWTSVTTQTAPFYLDVALSTPPKGAFWKVNLSAEQGDPATTVAAQLSAFLVLRND